MRRAPLTPGAFRRGQADLLSHASMLEGFLGQRQRAERQAGARTDWLLAQQQLAQEAADSASDLGAWLEGSSSFCRTSWTAGAREAEHKDRGGTSGDVGAELAPLEEGAVAEAVAVATAVARLMAAPGGADHAQPAHLAALQQRLLAAESSLRECMAATRADVQMLLQQAQFAAAARPLRQSDGTCGADDGDGGSLLAHVRRLCTQHPLAAEECVRQLEEQAAGLQARHQHQREQCKCAWRAFLAGTHQQQMGGRCTGGGKSGGGSSDGGRSGSSCSNVQDTWSGIGSASVATAVAGLPSLQALPQALGGGTGDRDGSSVNARSSSTDGSSTSGGDEWEGGEPDAITPRAHAAIATRGTADGWTADEHATFLHARHACLKPGTIGGSGHAAALVRRLAALLPTRSEQEVLQHEHWHKEAGRLQSAAQQTEAGWRQECGTFMAAAAALLAESEGAYLGLAQAALQQLETAACTLRCATCVGEMQAARADQQAAGMAGKMAAAAAAAAEKALQQSAAEHYRSRMHTLLAEHRQRQAEAAAAACAAEQAAAAEAAQQAAAGLAAGKQRVMYRQQQAAALGAARQEREAARKQECAQREVALQQLCAQVAPAVRRDARRAKGPTQSSAAAAAAAAAPHALFAQALGFTTEQVLSDQRFKVYEALSLLGLQASAAGRQAAAAARPARPPRPDTLTSAQRQGVS